MRRSIFWLWAISMWMVGVPAAAQVSQELDGPERQAMSDTVQYALEAQASNQAAEWVNPDTGRSGAVIPTRTYQNEQGRSCREFITTIMVGGREEQGYGTACRQPDGSWQIMQRRPAATVSRPTTIYLERPPERYYYYPADVYGASRIFLSFNFVYRSGHQHFGISYMDGPAFRSRHPVWGRKWMPPAAWRDNHYRRDYHDQGRHRGRR